jgi:hypothetical protein
MIPTTTWDTPSIVTERPTTARSAENFFCQNSPARMTTGEAAEISWRLNPRPIPGCT